MSSHLIKKLDQKDAQSVWNTLFQVDCREHIKTKGGFSYLSWSWAWSTLKKHYPEATFEKHLFGGLPYMIDAQGFAFVQVTVTIVGQSATEILPVLNHSNKPSKNPDSFAVNTALQRCLVKAIAFHGLGAYIYAGEDVPPGDPDEVAEVVAIPAPADTAPIAVVEHIEDTFDEFPEDPLLVSARQLTTIKELDQWERENGSKLNYIETNDPSLYASIFEILKPIAGG